MRSSQESAPIYLEASHEYNFILLHKEGGDINGRLITRPSHFRTDSLGRILTTLVIGLLDYILLVL